MFAPESAQAQARVFRTARVDYRGHRDVNCSIDDNLKLFFGEPTADELEQQAWALVNRAYSAPVNESDDEADYAPTQIIAEAFRMHGLDGLAYRSSLGKGLNFALFNPANADQINASLFRVSDVLFKFDYDGNSYGIKKYYPEAPVLGDLVSLSFIFDDGGEPKVVEPEDPKVD